MDYLVHSRAHAGVEPDDALTEEHWSYLDRFADGMTARGPTLSPDRATWTGSMHVLALASDADAAAFVSAEPYERAGLFASHRTWRFTNLLGRTMWEHESLGDLPRFLVLTSAPVELAEHQLLVHGELRGPDGTADGFVAAVQVRNRCDLDVLPGSAEVHAWEPGGRR